MVPITRDVNNLDSQVIRGGRVLRDHASLQPTPKTETVLISQSLTGVRNHAGAGAVDSRGRVQYRGHFNHPERAGKNNRDGPSK